MLTAVRRIEDVRRDSVGPEIRGMRLTTCRIPVSGMPSRPHCVSERVGADVELISRSDTADRARPYRADQGLTGGALLPADRCQSLQSLHGGRRVSCAWPERGNQPQGPRNGKRRRENGNSMKIVSQDDKRTRRTAGASRLRVSGEGRWRARLVGPVADADRRGKGIDGHVWLVDDSGDCC